MTPYHTPDILLNKLTRLESTELDDLLDNLWSIDKSIAIGFLNQHAYNLARKSPEFLNCVLEMDYLFRDGIGIKLACSINNVDPGLNLNGTDLIPTLLTRIQRCSSRPIQYFAMGTQEPWLTQGSSLLFNTSSVNTIDGFQSEIDYINFFQKNHIPGHLVVIILAMGMPKQEYIARKLKEITPNSTIIICGGAILDFAANRVNRAPIFLRKIGMEWAYRLWKEPKRLFGRYVVGIPLFFFYVFQGKK